MPIYEFEGGTPRIGASSYVHPTAVIIEDVVIDERCSVISAPIIEHACACNQVNRPSMSDRLPSIT